MIKCLLPIMILLTSCQFHAVWETRADFATARCRNQEALKEAQENLAAFDSIFNGAR